MKLNMYRFFPVLFFIVFIFVGCSKDEVSDDSPQVPSEPALKTGVFLDSPVEGLIYRTNSQEGTTNANGEFQYREGEKVSFLVGEIRIGEALGQEVITPLDIASTPDATINSLEVKNIAAFLQTLDADKNPENGIKISSEAVAALSVKSVDFTKPLIQLLGELALEVNKTTLADLKVVLPETAAANLARSLDLDFELTGLEAGPFYDIIEKWETGTSNVQWIHEFDIQGRIAQSTVYHKYPFQKAYVYYYSEYNAQGYPQVYRSERLKDDGSVNWTLYFYLTYSQNAEVSSIAYNSILNNPRFFTWKIENYDLKNRVTELVTYSNDVPGSRVYYEYDDSNNTNKLKIYDYGAIEPKRVEENYFTPFGSVDAKVVTQEGFRQERNYFFRDNYTLEKEIVLEYRTSEPEVKIVQFTDENRFVYRIENYSGGFLYEVTEKSVDGSLKKFKYNEEDGTYYIQYFNTQGQKYKTEYYDSDGNLISTEEH